MSATARPEPPADLVEARPERGAAMAPVSAAERIELLDILRGTALFGILAANMRAFAAPAAIYDRPDLLFPGFGDRLAQGLLDVFVSGKCMTLFAFLFGLGFAVQMSRAEARGIGAGAFYPRRLLALLMLGVAHGALLWWGDVLAAYALVGFVLLLFRKARPATILRWAAGMLLSILVLMSAAFVFFQFRPPQRPPETIARAEATRAIEVVNAGTWDERLAQNQTTWVAFLPSDVAVLVFLPTFLFGLWVWRRGIVQDVESHLGLLRATCRIALPAGLAVSVFAVVATVLTTPADRPGVVLYFKALAGFYGLPLLALGYGSGLALLVRDGRWRRRFAPAAAVGRMALTNYLMQSVMGVLLFTTTGLYGKVGPARLVLPTVAIFAGQVWLSNWWLRRFRFGPAEWFWRALTYARIPALRHPAAA